MAHLEQDGRQPSRRHQQQLPWHKKALLWLQGQRELSLALFVVFVLFATGLRWGSAIPNTPPSLHLDYKVHEKILGSIENYFTQLELQHFNMRQHTIVEDRTEKSQISLIILSNRTTGSPGMRKIYGKHPYPRDIYAKMIRFINRSQPKSLLIDAAFELGNDLEHPERDQAFADAVKEVPFRVITALIASNTVPDETTRQFLKSHRITLHGDPTKLFALRTQSANLPFPQLIESGAEFYPATNILYDYTQTVRYASPLVYFGFFDDPESPTNKKPTYLFYPNLVLSVLLGDDRSITILDNGDFKIGSHIIHTFGGGRQVIKWYGNVSGAEMRIHKNFEIYPKTEMWDILYSELTLECQEDPSLAVCKQLTPDIKGKIIDPKIFSNKYVVMGFAIENQDVHQTLYGTNYPGMYSQVTILDNYLNDDFIQALSWQWTLGLALLLAIVGGYLCYYRNVVFSLILVSCIGIGYTFLTFVAYTNYNLWLNWVYPITALLISVVLAFIIRYVRAESKKQQLRMAFAKYVSPAAMQAIEKDPTNLQLGGHRRELTFMFCDIRGFTAFSETHEADYVQKVLTQYFRVMNTIILNTFNGSINKLMGDAIMAYWGFPLTREDHPLRAVMAAFTMKRAIEIWQSDPMKPPIRIGIGINTGTAMIGNVGSEDFMDFTVIGDAVNIASRLEGLNKEYGTTIIISGETYDRIKPHVQCRELGSIKVRGKAQETVIYEPTDLLSPELAIQIDAVIPELTAMMENILLEAGKPVKLFELSEEEILDD